MKQFWLTLLLFLSLLSAYTLASCDLLYPPKYYESLSEQKTGPSGTIKSGAPKTWQTVGSLGAISQTATLSPVLRVNSAGEPCVLVSASSATTFWSYNPVSSWTSQQVSNFISPTAIGMVLDKGTDPFIAVADSSGNVYTFTNTTTQVGLPVSGGAPVSITSSNGKPAIAYNNNGSLCLSYYNGGWSSSDSLPINNLDYIDLEFSPNAGEFFLLEHDPSSTDFLMRAGTYFGTVTGFPQPVHIAVIDSSMPLVCTKAFNSVVYAAYADSTASPVNIYLFNTAGAAITTNGIFQLAAGHSVNYPPTMAILDANHIYLAYDEIYNEQETIKVLFYDGTSWSQLGGNVDSGYMPSIDLAPDGTPFVAYQDTSDMLISVKAYR